MHYYEDGNVRLTTRKTVSPTTISPSPSSASSISTAGATAAEIVKAIANLEGKYQKELNHGFAKLSEGEFKALRRQLPVTRQKVEWEKVGGYRVSSSHSSSCNISCASAFPLCAFDLFFFRHVREKLNGRSKKNPRHQAILQRMRKDQILTELFTPQLGQDIGGGRLR